MQSSHVIVPCGFVCHMLALCDFELQFAAFRYGGECVSSEKPVILVVLTGRFNEQSLLSEQ